MRYREMTACVVVIMFSQRAYDVVISVVLTSMRRHYVASTSVRRQFGVVCLVALRPRLISHVSCDVG